jgi:glycosyltransferase involved in cell wall biosynthesis
MKVTMVGDCAHVGYELARELRRRGHTVRHITFDHGSKLRYLKAIPVPLRLALDDCDLVHAHYARFPIYAAALSGKPFIAHCHGSDLRLGVSKVKEYFLKKARKIIVSTPDLLKFRPDATYLPNPVSWDFYDMGGPKKGAVYFKHKQDPCLPPSQLKMPYCEIRERDVGFSDMPKILNGYEYVVHNHYPVEYNHQPCLSKVALEALACGCKVVTWNGEVISNLPTKHRPEQVVDKLLEIYKEALS